MENSVSIIGLGHAFNHQYEALKKHFENIELCDIDKDKIKKYKATNDYNQLTSEIAVIATPPKSHLEVANQLILNNKKVIIEKPIVTNLNDLEELIKINNSNIYSSLHFAFGKEIDYLIKHNLNKKPKRIYSYISDNYVTNKRINKEQYNLYGSYLDEVINPLSAIARLFGYNIKFITNEKKYYEGDIYDYYSKSIFKLDDIEITIEVEWNNKKSQKYIDLEYEEETIRLDSMNQEVIDLKNNKILYKAKGDRMVNHYMGVINDYFKNNNFSNSIILHRELLKGV